MDMSVKALSGVGDKKSELLNKMGIFTIPQLLSLAPRRYDNLGLRIDISDLELFRGRKLSVIATVCRPIAEARISGGRILTTVYVSDGTDVLRIIFFNNPYIKNMLHQDATYLFFGKIPENGPMVLTAPEIYNNPEGLTKKLLPVYPLTAGINQKFMRKIIKEAYTYADFRDPLPPAFIKRYGLCGMQEAYALMHFPNDYFDVDRGRGRIIFNELLYYSLGVKMLRARRRKKTDFVITDIPVEFVKAHDFSPTKPQRQAILEISRDLASGTAMNRLLQGDVGSGKTFVAGQCAYTVIKNGAQAVIMVPTEVLANQHFDYFNEKFTPLGINCALLVSSVPTVKKREIKQGIADGSIQFVVATHAVLQNDVSFKNLGLVITDEQHRFGVMQRAALTEKGKGVHLLVMSATPIPRTLALMMWGDLDLSVIDVLPAGRQKISTYLVDGSYGDRLNVFIRKNIDAGGQVYVVCPLVEDDEESDLVSVTERYNGLGKIFGRQNVGFVHGKMKASEKESIMREFAAGDIKILVSTTVIEVGINVPDATLMVVENAERFGLSQLHQLRGRVGRGTKKSYCVLVSDNKNETTLSRLNYFAKTTDGFAIAKKDLELRGPGNFFGADQHGLSGLTASSLLEDVDILESASKCAGEMLGIDPTLDTFPDIKCEVMTLFESKGEIFN